MIINGDDLRGAPVLPGWYTPVSYTHLDVYKRQGYYRVEIELNGKLTRGMTVVDQRSVVGSIAGFTEDWSVRAPNVLVHHTINGAGWKQLLSSALI